MLRALAGSVVRRVGAATPSLPSWLLPPTLTPSGPSLFAMQMRFRKFPAWRHSKKAGRPHAGKGNAVWWQPLLPALAAERCANIGGQGSNDAKRNQIRRQQSLWDVAKRKEMDRRRAIFNALDRDAHMDRVRGQYARYADFLREHPDGFTPSPGQREQKRLWAAQQQRSAGGGGAAASSDAAAAPPSGGEAPSTG